MPPKSENYTCPCGTPIGDRAHTQMLAGKGLAVERCELCSSAVLAIALPPSLAAILGPVYPVVVMSAELAGQVGRYLTDGILPVQPGTGRGGLN